MTWTYDNSPGTSTAAERRDAVRLNIGDTDTTDQQVTDEEIAFALSEGSDDVYAAAASMADALAAKFSRLADTSFDVASFSFSKQAENYRKLAARMTKKALESGGANLGSPVGGGISISEMDSAEDDSDRPRPAFERGQFSNPPSTDQEEDWKQ